MASASSRSNLKSPTNIPMKKMPSSHNSLKLNGNLVGLPKQAIQIQQSTQHPNQQLQQHSQHLLPQHSQHPQPSPAPTLSTVVSQQQSPHIANSSSATVLSQIPSGLHHFHTTSSNIPSGNATSAAHSIPPRYQPPPQPSGGILKHIPNPNPKPGTSYYPDANIPPHLNIKYPPDIPKLASVYIPESVKAGPGVSRFAQRPPPHRLSAGHVQVHHDPDHHGRAVPQTQQQQQQSQQDMLKFVRKPDPDPVSGPGGVAGVGAMAGMLPGRLSAEQNRHLQNLLAELRTLKEANQRLTEDNQELRDLCCFLDDDRQKGRKLAREWQRFGRYTASVMRQEVSAYQNKLRQLDDKQQDLIRDNLELKELCLYLDEERAHVAANTLCVNCGAPTRPTLRDDGDGSSSSTNADETVNNLRQYERQIGSITKDLNMRPTLSDQTLQYVRSLERRIRQLEEERVANGEKMANIVSDPISNRPEAVVRALQVLEVREQLERDRHGNLGKGENTEQMDDGEKALVREMCNVVWRKLEDGSNGSNIETI